MVLLPKSNQLEASDQNFFILRALTLPSKLETSAELTVSPWVYSKDIANL